MVERFFNRMLYLGGGLVASGIILTRFTFVVDGGERAIIFNKLRGVQNKVYGEGMHLKIPILMVPKYLKLGLDPKPFTQALVLEISKQ